MPLNLAWAQTEHPAFGRFGPALSVPSCEFIGDVAHEASALVSYARAGSSLKKGCIPFSFDGAGRDTASRNRTAVPLAIRCCHANSRWPDLLDWSASRIAAARPKAIGCTLEESAVGEASCFLIQTQNQINSVQETQGIIR